MSPVDPRILNLIMGNRKRASSGGEAVESRELQNLGGEEWSEVFEDYIEEHRRAEIRGGVRQGRLQNLMLTGLAEKAFAHAVYANAKRRNILSPQAAAVSLPLLPKDLKPGHVHLKQGEEMGAAEFEGETMELTDEEMLQGASHRSKKSGGRPTKKRRVALNSSGSRADEDEAESVPLLTLDEDEVVTEEDEEEEGDESVAEGKWDAKKETLDSDTTLRDVEKMGEPIKSEVIDHVLLHPEKFPSLYLAVTKKLLDKNQLRMHLLRQKSKLRPALPEDLDSETHEDIGMVEIDSGEGGEGCGGAGEDGEEKNIKGTRSYSFKNKTFILDQTNRMWRGQSYRNLRFRKAQV